ncbi:pyridoxamine 5'-phosphate oxidase family protein [Dinoroseobacter sp. S124A]|uniref:pyridoxamine 5'-phosphate oxidase family protein n=1 Tax=Dinoroseobacter sp. S124A TaxID=3415128 RepID=UPI003C7BDFBB
MAKQFPRIGLGHQNFIEAQQIFFVATAAPEGRVNLSPKGMDSLRVLGPNRIAWLNVTGSGNETAGHLKQSPRMTLMWCSFDATPMILRAYGTARTVQRDSADWAELADLFPGGPEKRQVYDLSVEMVQTSCGYAVPTADGMTERPVLKDWAADKGEDGIRAYWAERNRTTIDGAPTGIEDNL